MGLTTDGAHLAFTNRAHAALKTAWFGVRYIDFDHGHGHGLVKRWLFQVTEIQQMKKCFPHNQGQGKTTATVQGQGKTMATAQGQGGTKATKATAIPTVDKPALTKLCTTSYRLDIRQSDPLAKVLHSWNKCCVITINDDAIC